MAAEGGAGGDGVLTTRDAGESCGPVGLFRAWISTVFYVSVSAVMEDASICAVCGSGMLPTVSPVWLLDA
eukprot:752302-Hanusia_phi.AAC.7